MTRLRLLEGGTAEEEAKPFPAAVFDLSLQPMRPGMAHEQLEIVLDAGQLGVVVEAARAAGVPVPLWTGIAVESERALRAAARVSGVARDRLGAVLDLAARHPDVLKLVRGQRRLVAYARALRHPNAAEQRLPTGRVSVLLAYHSLAAWQAQAATEGVPVEEWVVAMLALIPVGRLAWEAAAAEAGQTLGEWVALQAARCASC